MKKNNWGSSQIVFLFVFAFVLNMWNFELVQAHHQGGQHPPTPIRCDRNGPVCPSGQGFRCPLTPRQGDPLYPCCNYIFAGCSKSQGEAGSGRNCNTGVGQCVNQKNPRFHTNEEAVEESSDETDSNENND